MHTNHRASALFLFGAVSLCASAWAADKAVPTPAQVRYEQERAVCMSGRSNQDRATCLREASAALADARGAGPNEDPAKYRQNARQRCVELPDGDRQACLARMQGAGSTTGSAAAGGILRENVTIEVAPPGAAASSPAAPASAP